jgi:hypothetical protein
MPEGQLNQYGYVSGSKYEDVEAVSRIGTAEMKLSGDFDVFHKEVLQNFYRLAGHIYSSADLQKLAIENRPDFEWNLFLPIILSIVGNFKQNIPGLDITGITQDDHRGAKLQDQLMKFYLHQANRIEYEFAIAFLYAIVGRIGWLKTSYDSQKDADGMVNVSWYDPLRLKFDTNWQRRDTSDMRFMSDGGWYDPEEIIQLFAKRKPDLREEIYEKGLMIAGESTIRKGKLKRMLITWAERFLNASIQYGGRKQGYDNTVDNIRYGYSGTWYNGDGRFKVIDFYEKRLLPTMSIIDMATGEEKDVTEEVKSPKENRFSNRWFDQEKLQLQREQMIEPQVTQEWTEVIWQTSVVPGMNLVLHDAEQKFQNKQFKFLPVLCYDFHPEILETKSIMDHIIDPVSSYNMRRNTILTYVMRAAHGGYMAEENAVAGFEDDFESNEIGGLKKVRDGALAQKRIVPINPAPYPEALKIEAESEKEDINMISASTPNVRGREESKSESGKLFDSRVAQADIMQEWISENAQATLELVGKNLISLGQRFLTMPRTILILGDESDPQWLMLNQYYLGKIMNDPTYGKYNISISKAPYGRFAQDREFQTNMQMAEWLANFDPQLVPIKVILESSPLRNKKEWISHLEMVTGDLSAQMEFMKQQQELEQQQISKQTHMELMQQMVQLEKTQLENYQLADQIVNENLYSNTINAGGARQSPRAQLTN